MSQSVEEPSAAIVSSDQKKRKTPDDDDKQDKDVVMKRLDQYQRGARKLLLCVMTLLQEYKVPPADEFEPIDEDGNMQLKWTDQKAALYLAYDCSPLITMDAGDNPTLEFEHPRQAIRTLAALLNIPEKSVE